MDCKAEFSILGSDNVFVRLGIDPCTIGVLEIVVSACVFGVLLFSVHHAASKLVTWFRWYKLKISTRSQDEVDGRESNRPAIETAGATEGNLGS